jgi:hypothetical protein
LPVATRLDVIQCPGEVGLNSHVCSVTDTFDSPLLKEAAMATPESIPRAVRRLGEVTSARNTCRSSLRRYRPRHGCKDVQMSRGRA